LIKLETAIISKTISDFGLLQFDPLSKFDKILTFGFLKTISAEIVLSKPGLFQLTRNI
jgi:hypothetical protein